MSEQFPNAEEERQLRYSSVRAHLLHIMCRKAWGNASNDGDTESPTGAFWRISNEERDIPLLEDAFGDDMRLLGLPVAAALGHFLVTESQAGYVTAVPYDTEDELLDDFFPMFNQYEQWRASGGGEA